MKKRFKILIIIIILIIVGLMTTSIVFNVRNDYKYIEVDRTTRQNYINILNKDCNSEWYSINQQQARELLEDEMDFHTYIYSEGSVKNGGISIALLRYIRVDAENLDIERYCFALCHEICHIKYFTGNEIYTNFMTFKTLYESENEQLKKLGTMFGIYVLNGLYEQNYDCSYLIIEYLSESICNYNIL